MEITFFFHHNYSQFLDQIKNEIEFAFARKYVDGATWYKSCRWILLRAFWAFLFLAQVFFFFTIEEKKAKYSLVAFQLFYSTFFAATISFALSSNNNNVLACLLTAFQTFFFFFLCELMIALLWWWVGPLTLHRFRWRLRHCQC